MSRALTVAGREFRASLTSPLGYVFLTLFALITLVVFFFSEGFFGANHASARGLFRWIPPLLAFVAPALTMRLWADERKMGTYEILTTLPKCLPGVRLGPPRIRITNVRCRTDGGFPAVAPPL